VILTLGGSTAASLLIGSNVVNNTVVTAMDDWEAPVT
jgi:hypothetical protein